MDDGQTAETPRRQHGATDDGPDSVRVARWLDLLAALRGGPLRRDELLARLGSAYAPGDSGRRTLARDAENLGLLGIRIKISNNRPPVYTLVGPLPIFTEDELRALALVRDSFGARHPQSKPVRTLLERLTNELEPDERRIYQRRQALRVPLEPAIDYTPHAKLIERLEAAVSIRQRLTFAYRSLGSSEPRVHTVEPIDIEFRDRHFYLVVYSLLGNQVYDLRIDRIIVDARFKELDRIPPGTEHQRKPVTFRYRLAAALARDGLSQRFDNQRVIETLPNGDVVVEAEGRSDFFIIQTLLRYGSRAVLLSPPELKAQILGEIERMCELYSC
ncbi:MAG: hypothetical protein OHK0022_49130 [Roseiflexaceae bacterium]